MSYSAGAVAVASLAIVFSGCSLTDDCRNMHRVDLSLDARENNENEVVLTWKLRNSSQRPVWVPKTWGYSFAEKNCLPMPFYLPRKQLLLLAGAVDYTREQRKKGRIEGDLHVEYVQLLPGQVDQRVIALRKPWEPWVDVRSVFQFKEPNYENRGAIEVTEEITESYDRISSVIAATEVFLSSPF